MKGTHNLGCSSDGAMPYKTECENDIVDFSNTFHLGDRLEAMNKLPSEYVDFIFTSPPYNVDIPYGNHKDSMPYNEYLEFLNDTWKESKRVLKKGGRIAINITSMTCKTDDGLHEWKCLYNDVINQMLKLDFIIRCDILWYKQAMSKRTAWGSWMSPSNPHVIQPYEFIFVFSKHNKKHNGEKKNIDITREEFLQYSDAFWNVSAETRLSKYHPAPFPKELVYRLIKFYTYKNDIVLDMFGGSGTTALVSYENNRNFIYIDNCKKYLDFAKKRILGKPKKLF